MNRVDLYFDWFAAYTGYGDLEKSVALHEGVLLIALAEKMDAMLSMIEVVGPFVEIQ